MRLLILLVMMALTGCAVPLTSAGEKIAIISVQQKEKCERVKLITVNQRVGSDKSGNAMKSALNEAGAAGADSFFVISNSTDWAEGASVVGEALRCKK